MFIFNVSFKGNEYKKRIMVKGNILAEIRRYLFRFYFDGASCFGVRGIASFLFFNPSNFLINHLYVVLHHVAKT